MQDFQGNRPNEQPSETTTSVGGHDDQIDLVIASASLDAFRGLATLEQMVNCDTFEASVREAFELMLLMLGEPLADIAFTIARTYPEFQRIKTLEDVQKGNLASEGSGNLSDKARRLSAAL